VSNDKRRSVCRRGFSPHASVQKNAEGMCIEFISSAIALEKAENDCKWPKKPLIEFMAKSQNPKGLVSGAIRYFF
jgi:hypothetical protein